MNDITTRERTNAVNDTITHLDHVDEDALAPDVSDEALEAAAGTEKIATMGPGSCWMGGGRIC